MGQLKIIQAKTFIQRLFGLIIYRRLEKDEIFFIPNCRAIHTFFMSYPIDVIFVDKNSRIVRVKEGLKPFRFCFAGREAKHVYEAGAGFISREGMEKLQIPDYFISEF